jgi:nucleoid-associated protein YgaU
LIDPDTVNTRHENRFTHSKGINTSGRKADYAFSSSDELTLQLTLDNTLSTEFLPASPFASGDTIKDTVDEFLKYCFYMDGDIHEPRYLLVEWGKFNFECRLKSISVSYSKFDDQGTALRANFATVFVADMPDAKRIKLENKKSPDITHSRIVLEGQTLTGLTREVYGDAAHFLTVARANRLDHFRELKPGSRLHFPPLDK